MDPSVIFALHLATFTGLHGQPVEVNPDQVVTLRSKRDDGGGNFPAHAGCVLHMTDGHFVVVMEDCATVQKRLEGGQE
jgi:hypothetical protein